MRCQRLLSNADLQIKVTFQELSEQHSVSPHSDIDVHTDHVPPLIRFGSAILNSELCVLRHNPVLNHCWIVKIREARTPYHGSLAIHSLDRIVFAECWRLFYERRYTERRNRQNRGGIILPLCEGGVGDSSGKLGRLNPKKNCKLI